MEPAAREFLETLLHTPSPTGSEQQIQRKIHDRFKGVAHAIEPDVHGNLILSLNPRAKPRRFRTYPQPAQKRRKIRRSNRRPPLAENRRRSRHRWVNPRKRTRRSGMLRRATNRVMRGWPRWDSNPHALWATDFESVASANSATRPRNNSAPIFSARQPPSSNHTFPHAPV